MCAALNALSIRVAAAASPRRVHGRSASRPRRRRDPLRGRLHASRRRARGGERWRLDRCSRAVARTASPSYSRASFSASAKRPAEMRSSRSSAGAAACVRRPVPSRDLAIVDPSARRERECGGDPRARVSSRVRAARAAQVQKSVRRMTAASPGSALRLQRVEEVLRASSAGCWAAETLGPPRELRWRELVARSPLFARRSDRIAGQQAA